MMSNTGSPSSMALRSSSMCSSRATGRTRDRMRPGRLSQGCADGGAVLGVVRAGVVERQVERECAALAVDAGEPDFAAEQHGQLAADRQAETGAAVFAAKCRRRPAGRPRR